jgi:protein-disulfide isomerase
MEALKAGQRDLQKNIQIIKDLLMGKQPPLEDVVISTAGAQFQGDAKAKVVLLEFSDFQCPFCGRYAVDTYPKIITDYVKTGKIRYAIRNFPLDQLHPLAEKAAEGAECAGDQGKYWEMHERLFKNQASLEPRELLGHATVLGLDQAKFQQCLDTGKFTAKIKSDVADGNRLNVRGTPTFFFGYPDPKDPSRINAVKLMSGSQPIDAFAEILDGLLNPPKTSAAGN